MAVRRIVRRKRVMVKDPNAEQKIAAATTVCKEIVEQYHEAKKGGEAPNDAAVMPYNYTFTTEVEGGWRKVSLNQGHSMAWRGGVRVSKKGEILFSLIPEMNEHLTARKATSIEISHTQLVEAFGSGAGDFPASITELMGATIPELIEQAMFSISGDDLAAAEATPEEPEILSESTVADGFGAWA